ncbi:winged helix-turn-helix transcriptional regulator [Candidatus Woesearchaeota archaeon]|nr:winged helix-turn-helix transcriptional regulator [Candidatus Woesearchaeota archaeon]
MAIRHHRITIIRYRKPKKKDLNDELQFFGNSLGLFGDRDKDRSCFRIFIELLKSARTNRGMTSDEIAIKTGLSRGTAVHHLKRLMDSGLVVYEEGRYFLRAGNLEAVMEEISKDVFRTMDDLTRIAKEIDSGLGL